MLNNIFITNQIKDDIDSIQQWGRDWTFKGKSNAKAIVFPESEEQIRARVGLLLDLGRLRFT